MTVERSERRPAWYAVSPGKWGDWITILHPPYTAWHLSYVLIGAGLATHINAERLVATLLAFALAVGVAAHALDEVRGRPLGTSIPSSILAAVAGVSLCGAAALGAVGISQVGWGLAPFIAVGVVLVVAYNLELFHGRLHNDFVFAVSWGAFPLLTAYYAQTGRFSLSALCGAVFAYRPLEGTENTQYRGPRHPAPGDGGIRGAGLPRREPANHRSGVSAPALGADPHHPLLVKLRTRGGPCHYPSRPLDGVAELHAANPAGDRRSRASLAPHSGLEHRRSTR